MEATDGHVRRSVLLLVVCALATGLGWWNHSAFTLAALSVLALVTVVATESLHVFVQGKRGAQRVQSQPAVMRISRAVYNQLDADTLQLLASTRDFDEQDYERLLQLDTVRDGGATHAQIERLPLVVFTKQMLEASHHVGCSICLSPIALHASVRLLRCFHHFHPDCIDPWLKGKAECPMCKFPVIA